MLKNIVRVCLLTLLFVQFNVLNAQIAANWEVGTWSQFKTSAISYTMDDGTSNQLPVAIPLFNNYNFKVTLFTVTNWSPNWTALQTHSNNGHEIASHTVSHATLSSSTTATQDTECKNSQTTINSNITNTKCVTIAYPNCNTGDIPTISKYYIAGRTCSGQIISSSPTDFYNLSSIICGSTGVNTAQALNDKITQAKNSKGWCVFLFHGFNGDGGYSPIESSVVNTHLTYVQNNAADYWVGTFGNVVKYIKERNAAKLTETAISSDSLQIALTDGLDNTIYDAAITVRRTLPSGWTNARVWLGTTKVTSTIVTTGGKTYVMFDVKPDAGTIYVANPDATTSTTPRPTVVSPLKYAKNATASALTATGTALKWYTVASGGTASTTAPVPSTATVGSTTYYVTQTIGGVESARASIVVNVYQPQSPYGGTPWPIPGKIEFEDYDTGGQDTAYYDSSSGSETGEYRCASVECQDEDVDLEVCTDVGGGYNVGYAVATEWLEYTVNVASAGTYNLTLRVACNGGGRTVSLSAKGVTIANNIAVPNTGGWQTWTDLAVNNITLTAGIQVIRVTIGATDYVNMNYMTFSSLATAPPTVTTPVNYCQGATATALTATGTALKWYTVATGGTASTTAPIPSTATVGSTTYYVTQTLNSLESARASIVVNVTATPAAPTVTTPVNYTQGATATALTATGTGLKWYTVATGGTGSATAPVPSTTTAGTVSYYVSQTSGTCESSRSLIEVVVSPVVLPKVALKAGWNLIGCPITGSTNIANALSSVWSQVESVKNADYYWHVTNTIPGLNTLLQLKWGQGYLIKVKSNCELDWIVR